VSEERHPCANEAADSAALSMAGAEGFQSVLRFEGIERSSQGGP
jgi:hypothetical protein